MSTLNLSIVPGYQWASDALKRIRYTKTRSNLAASPTGTVLLTNLVATEDIKDANVTKAKLENTVADAILTAVATVSDEATNVVTVSVQIKDIQGNDLAAVCKVEFWLASTGTGGAPAALPSGGAPTVSAGTAIVAVSASAPGIYLTNSSGLLVMAFTEAGALTRYFSGIIGGKLVAGSKTMTWST